MKTKQLHIIILLLIAAVLLSGVSDAEHPASPVQPPQDMVFVAGARFMMGNSKNHSDALPIHQVTVDSFYINQYEVTQAEWQDVMGNNPSLFKEGNNAAMPVEQVTWYDAVEYCNKRSRKEGFTPCYSGSGENIRCNFEADGYRLPTEAEWEFAAIGGNNSRGFIFSGSNSPGAVAWYEGNCQDRPQAVGQKKANELGLYDMSGNVWEWCWDWYAENYYTNSPKQNPRGPNSGDSRSYRGGGGPGGRIEWLRNSGRFHLEASYKCFDMGFRVVRSIRNIKSNKRPSPARMVLVQGGTFSMGSQFDRQCDKPAHPVTLKNFYISKYEVTQEQFRAVMGYNPSYWPGAKSPVEMVTWYDAITYCNKRSQMEGLKPCYSGSGDNITCDFSANGYRLPTEAEWEFAARGGASSLGYNYSGSNDAEKVAWCKDDGEFRAQPAGLKQPNELGLYDMSGNLLEWCWDWFGWDYYQNSPGKDPQGPAKGIRRVLRGGNFKHPAPGLSPTKRFPSEPHFKFTTVGFRVVRAVK